jgi:tRNA-specific 2-thiouridylase
MNISIEKALEQVEGHIPKGQTVAVGMSGGVDSSVGAALLKELGYDVVGLFMKNWDEGPDCPSEKDAQDVALVAKKINIPFYTINFTKEYKESIFESFLSDLKKGLTPNPDILCNREVKFKKLLEKALFLGASCLATGHYAKNTTHDLNHFFLERPLDSSKDQTYFLYTANQESLSKTLFPLANLKKSDIRHLASLFDLPVATKKDSTGICFIGERNFTEFLKPYLGYSPGPMFSIEGQPIGSHIGLAYYTIGQRKGLKIGGEGST